MIFEILNSKGKHLSDVDLIKNKIFEVLVNIEPADFATAKWDEIKDILNDVKIGFATFYRHFWISKYKKTGATKLFDSFNKTIKPKNETRYEHFLDELVESAKIYKKIVDPQKKDFDNRKEYNYVVQALNTLSNSFNITQVRVALLALINAKNNDLLSLTELNNCVKFLENFHFSYNAIGSNPTNRIESKYSKFSINLNKCKSKSIANKLIEDLQNDLSQINILYPEFETQFIKLCYSKKENSSNIKTKYAINKINCFFEKNEIFLDDGSIEHIIPEKGDALTLNIGNLILLEGHINKKAAALAYNDKIKYYISSKYKWMNDFINEYTIWDSSKIEKRAKDLALLYYTKILGRKVNE